MSAISSSLASTVSQASQSARRPDGDGPARFRNDFGKALSAMGIDQSKVGDIQKQVDEAVQKVKDSGGDRSAFKSAVDSVLQNNGIDPAKFQAEVKKTGGHRHHHRDSDAAQSTPQAAQPAPSSAAFAPGMLDVTA